VVRAAPCTALRAVHFLCVVTCSHLRCSALPDHAAAAMDVGIGSASDPEELPGLAHFLEHMLFLGTERYPQEDAYQSYLEQHGGSSNAFTQHENTTYFFDVQHDFLRGALDRFAQFFLCPLFTESATAREMKAVDSENSKNLQSDAWRLQQIHKMAADPRHPWSRFNTGSLDTLSDKPASHVKLDLSTLSGGGGGGAAVSAQLAAHFTPALTVRSALIDFHARHYSANLMSLAVLGRQSLDELEQLVVPLFAAVPNRDVPLPTWPHEPYPAERLRRHFKVRAARLAPTTLHTAPPRSTPPHAPLREPRARTVLAPLFATASTPRGRPPRWQVVPVKDFSSLTIGWPLPSIRKQYLSKPFRYVSHILGHEAEGSLLSLLKEKGLADSLVAGETRSHSDFSTFEVTMELTEAANARADEIVALVFSCLKMISARPPDKCAPDIGHSLSHWPLVSRNVSPPGGCRRSRGEPPLAPLVSPTVRAVPYAPLRSVHDEMHDLGKVSFRFRDTVDPSSAVLSVVASLQLHPPKHALSAPFLFEEFAADEISALLALLTPERACVVHVARDHEAIATMREPWYDTSYHVSQMTDELLAACAAVEVHSSLAWPEPNPFIPTDFALVCDAPGAPPAKVVAGADSNPTKISPTLVREDGLAKLWHKADATFRRPKANIFMEVMTPAAYAAPSAACLTRLFFRLVNDELTEFAYPAECAPHRFCDAHAKPRAAFAAVCTFVRATIPRRLASAEHSFA
jgi:insulysin